MASRFNIYLGKRAWLTVTSGDIGPQSPMSPLVTVNHALSRYEMDLNRYETVQK